MDKRDLKKKKQGFLMSPHSLINLEIRLTNYENTRNKSCMSMLIIAFIGLLCIQMVIR